MNQLNTRWLIEHTFAQINQPKAERVDFFQLTLKPSTIIKQLIMMKEICRKLKVFKKVVEERELKNLIWIHCEQNFDTKRLK